MITQFIVVELWIVGQWAKGGENRSKNFRCLRANFVRSINRSIVAFIIWTSLKFILVVSWKNLSGLLRYKITSFIWSLLNKHYKYKKNIIYYMGNQGNQVEMTISQWYLIITLTMLWGASYATSIIILIIVGRSPSYKVTYIYLCMYVTADCKALIPIRFLR